jgi:hypothetical protein
MFALADQVIATGASVNKSLGKARDVKAVSTQAENVVHGVGDLLFAFELFENAG